MVFFLVLFGTGICLVCKEKQVRGRNEEVKEDKIGQNKGVLTISMDPTICYPGRLVFTSP